RANAEKFFIAQSQDQIRIRHYTFNAHQKSAATYFRNHIWIAINDRCQTLFEDKGRILYLIEKTIRQHYIQHGVAYGHGQRIAAKGRAMGASGHALGSLRSCKANAHRKTAANAFGDRHNIWGNARPFISKEFSGTTNTRLHFIEHHQQAIFVADLTHQAHKFIWHQTQAALALYWFKQNSCGFGSYCSPKSCFIAKSYLIKTIDFGAKAFQIFGLPASSDSSKGAAMESGLKSNNAIALRIAVYIMITPRGFNRAFQRFSTGIGKKRLICKSCVDEALAQFFLAGNRIKI